MLLEIGYTQFSYVIHVESFDPAQNRIRVRRKVEGDQEVLEGVLPALLTVELELARPRRASLPNLMNSLKQEVRVWNKDTIAADPNQLGIKGSPTWVRKIGAPPPRESGPRFEAAQGLNNAVNQSLENLMGDGFMAEELGLEQG